MKYLILFLLHFTLIVQAQQANETLEFTFNEYLGYVKKFHPLVKTANLEINKAQANLMAARGAFDPKIAVDFDKKQFKDTEYYSILNSSFKIPTWYGIEIKAGFDQNEGYYLNPENTVPSTGLNSFGISVPIGQGLFINQRMADLRKAKMQIQLSQDQQREISKLITREKQLGTPRERIIEMIESRGVSRFQAQHMVDNAQTLEFPNQPFPNQENRPLPRQPAQSPVMPILGIIGGAVFFFGGIIVAMASEGQFIAYGAVIVGLMWIIRGIVNLVNISNANR